MDSKERRLWAALGIVAGALLSLLGWVGLEVYKAVERHENQIVDLRTEMHKTDNRIRDRVSTLEGEVRSIQGIQATFMQTMIGRIPTPQPGLPSVDGPGIDHAE